MLLPQLHQNRPCGLGGTLRRGLAVLLRGGLPHRAHPGAPVREVSPLGLLHLLVELEHLAPDRKMPKQSSIRHGANRERRAFGLVTVRDVAEKLEQSCLEIFALAVSGEIEERSPGDEDAVLSHQQLVQGLGAKLHLVRQQPACQASAGRANEVDALVERFAPPGVERLAQALDRFHAQAVVLERDAVRIEDPGVDTERGFHHAILPNLLR